MVIIAAAVAVLAVAADDGREATEPTTPTSTSDGATPKAEAAPAEGDPPAANATSDLPPAPWRAAPVPRSAVPPAYVSAWDRAANRAGCALLFPLDGGPALKGAEATEERTPGDRGWDISLTGETGRVEILGLFDKTDPSGPRSDRPRFTRTWADGSVATYAAEVGNAVSGTFDPNTSPFEAVLALPDQACAYRIYDSLGKGHLESVFDRLRLMTP